MASYAPGPGSPARNSQQAASPFRLGSNLTRYMQQKPPMYANAGVQGGPVKLGVAPTPNPGPSVNVSPGYSPEPHVQEPHGGGFGPHAQTGPAPTLLPGQSSPSTPGTPAPPKPPPSPLDSTYFANVAQNQFGVNNKINALNTQGGLADTSLQTSLGNLAYQQPRDELQTEEAAGRRGGVYSTVLDQQLGDLAHSYLTRETAAQTSHDNGALQRAAQISALQQGVPLYNTQQAAAAAIRAANLNAKNSALGEPTKPLVPARPRVTPGNNPKANSVAATFVHRAAKNGAPWAKALLNNPYVMKG